MNRRAAALPTLAALAAAFLILPLGASTVSVSFNGTAGSAWSAPANWTPATPPAGPNNTGTVDFHVLAPTGSVLVDPPAVTVNSLGATVPVLIPNGSSLTLTGGGDFAPPMGATLYNGVSLQVASGATLTLQGSVVNDGVIGLQSGAGTSTLELAGATTFDGTGQLQLGDAANARVTGSYFGVSLENAAAHTITGQGVIQAEITDLTNNGLIQAVGGVLTLDGNSIYNNGILSAAAGGTLLLANRASVLNSGGTVGEAGGGTVQMQDGYVEGGTLAGSLEEISNRSAGQYTMLLDTTLTGSFNVRTGAELNVSGLLQNEGAITVQSGGVLSMDGSPTISGSGTITLNGGTVSGPLDLQGGTLTGSGTVNGDVQLDGGLAPGASPGKLQVNGGLTLADTSTLDFEIGGYVAGTGFDQVVVRDILALGGVLNVHFIDGFSPVRGDSFALFQFGSLSGGFSAVNVLGVDPEFAFGIVADGNDLLLKDDATPEPEAWTMLLAGMLLVGVYGGIKRGRRSAPRP